jgi:hypothetical protein
MFYSWTNVIWQAGIWWTVAALNGIFCEAKCEGLNIVPASFSGVV